MAYLILYGTKEEKLIEKTKWSLFRPRYKYPDIFKDI